MASYSTSTKTLMTLAALIPLGVAQMTTTLNIPFMAHFETDDDPAWTPALNGTLLGINYGATTISLNCPTIESYCQTDGGSQQTITISGSSFELWMWGEESQTLFVEDCQAQATTDIIGDTTTTAVCTASLGYSSNLQNVVTTWWSSAPVYPVTVSGFFHDAAATTTSPAPASTSSLASTTTATVTSSSPSSSHSPVPTTKMLLPFEAPLWASFASNTPVTFNASVLNINNKVTTMSFDCWDNLGMPCDAVATQLMTFGPGVYNLYLNGPNYWTNTQTCPFDPTIATAAVSSNITALCTESYGGPSAIFTGIITTTETDFSMFTVLASGAALATSTSTIGTSMLTTSATTTAAATSSHTGAALRPTPGVEALGLLVGGTAAALAAGFAGIALL